MSTTTMSTIETTVNTTRGQEVTTKARKTPCLRIIPLSKLVNNLIKNWAYIFAEVISFWFSLRVILWIYDGFKDSFTQ